MVDKRYGTRYVKEDRYFLVGLPRHGNILQQFVQGVWNVLEGSDVNAFFRLITFGGHVTVILQNFAKKVSRHKIFVLLLLLLIARTFESHLSM